MAEPEDLILEGAHFATRVARDAWRKYGPATDPRVITLGSVRQRLELFLCALFGRDLPIVPAEPPAPVSWLAHITHRTPRYVRHPAPLAGTDGQRIHLPPAVPHDGSDEHALALYRLLAVEQGARMLRGTAAVAAALHEPAVRERFLIAEAAVVDAWIHAQVPGLRPVLRQARAAARAGRPPNRALLPSERAVERLLVAALSDDPSGLLPGLLASAAPDDTAAWARATADAAPVRDRFRGVAPVTHWGRLVDPAGPIQTAPLRAPADDAERTSRRPRVVDMPRRPRMREAREDEDDPSPGTWVIRPDEPQESVEDPLGLQRPADRDDEADPDGLGDSLSELPEARVVRTPGRAREVLRSGAEIPRPQDTPAPPSPMPAAIAYPEWDYRDSRYILPGAIVREPHAAGGDPAWARASLSRHARLVRQVRVRFERLRPRRERLARQTDGDELDIDACVTAAADRRAGGVAESGLYVAHRRIRRELTVALLVDVSASTDAWVSAGSRIVDVEKDALLVVCEALDALGDPYGVFAFSGEGPERVTVLPLKAFDERNGNEVRCRVAALEPDGYTRIGAAMRHVTAALCRQATRQRLLLVLSDGKPNDVDAYEGRYGVEDARQAVAEARRQGVSVFCLTIDREAPRYAVRVFGPCGFAVLRRPGQLPSVLVEALRHLIRS